MSAAETPPAGADEVRPGNSTPARRVVVIRGDHTPTDDLRGAVNEVLSAVGGITVETDDDGTLVTLVGEIDAALREQASLAMAEVAGHQGGLVVDLAAVTFIDSSGLAFVIQLVRLAEEGGRPVVLRDPPEHVMDVIEMVGLRGRVPVEHTTTEPGPAR